VFGAVSVFEPSVACDAQRDYEYHHASRVGPMRPTMVILAGRPADALVTYARRHDIDLLVVGARGRGRSDRLLGSVAEQLVRTPDVLVLVGGRAASVPTEQRIPGK
jgi:nucleotide-binding universal stress UspA family protein